MHTHTSADMGNKVKILITISPRQYVILSHLQGRRHLQGQPAQRLCPAQIHPQSPSSSSLLMNHRHATQDEVPLRLVSRFVRRACALSWRVICFTRKEEQLVLPKRIDRKIRWEVE
ncbi:hypothetical protein CEXT_1911 [Caerostris extrusa]|uniref:Uncharacterized protein n=1 Tax=Caerostris extrusa TaxID=172846 RepID=A0AAV4XKC9_CAEEX|nr:hypothetical protein CEXT_1911 [Caerostris extrusa]